MKDPNLLSSTLYTVMRDGLRMDVAVWRKDGSLRSYDRFGDTNIVPQPRRLGANTVPNTAFIEAIEDAQEPAAPEDYRKKTYIEINRTDPDFKSLVDNGSVFVLIGDSYQTVRRIDQHPYPYVVESFDFIDLEKFLDRGCKLFRSITQYGATEPVTEGELQFRIALALDPAVAEAEPRWTLQYAPLTWPEVTPHWTPLNMINQHTNAFHQCVQQFADKIDSLNAELEREIRKHQ